MLVLDESTLRTMLAEDAPYGDLTTRSLSLAGVPARMEFRARNAMTVCGLEEAARLIELSGGRIDKMPAVSGDTVEAGGLLLVAQGPAPSLFLAWKVSQTLVEWLRDSPLPHVPSSPPR